MLETARLRLRPLEASDVDIYHGIWGDSEVIWWGASPDRETSAEKLAAVVDRCAAMPAGLGWWWLELLTDGVTVGDVFLQPASDPPGGIEIGWHLARAHWGNGYAQEGAASLLSHAWSLEVDEVTAPIVPTSPRFAWPSGSAWRDEVHRSKRKDTSTTYGWRLAPEAKGLFGRSMRPVGCHTHRPLVVTWG